MSGTERRRVLLGWVGENAEQLILWIEPQVYYIVVFIFKIMLLAHYLFCQSFHPLDFRDPC